MKRSKMLQGLEQDIQDHIARETEDNIARGMSPADARTAAMRKFGNVTLVKEDAREVWTVVWLERLAQDVKFGLRLMKKTPVFTAVAVLTLALAIGANAIVFGVMNALILHPLDLPRSESLYDLEHANEDSSSSSYPNYIDLRDRNHTFENIAAYDVESVALDTGNGDPAPAWAVTATGNLFDTLGIEPYMGRFFHAADEHGPNSAPYAVLTYAYWHTHLHDDRGIIGRVVQLNKHPFTVIGVAPAGFRGTILFFTPDLYVPIVNEEQVSAFNYLNARNNQHVFEVLGRLKPGVSRAQAISDLNAIGAELEKAYPESNRHMAFRLAKPGLYGDYLGTPVRGFVAGLTLLSALILLAACANLGSLFAARAADRSREVAVRLALGATRKRVLRQLLTEAVMIATLGGALGLWASMALLRSLASWQPLPRFPITLPVHPDPAIYGVAVLLAIGSGLLFGLTPWRQVQNTDPYQIIKAGSVAKPGRRITGRDLLLAFQIAICAVLVTSSFVAVRGLVRALHSNFGFDPQNTLLVNTELNMAGYTTETAPIIQKRMLDAVAALPNVESVALNNAIPLDPDGQRWTVYNDKTTDLRASNAAATVYTYEVSPGYLQAARSPLLSGRDFTWHDDKGAPRVALVNQQFARKLFHSEREAIGGHFKMNDGERIEVVGIVSDAKYSSLTENPKPAMFLPILQWPTQRTWLIVRGDFRAGGHPQLAADIRTTLHAIDSGLPVTIMTWDDDLKNALFPSRIATLALGVLGAIAAVLSITGIFGLAAYSVSKRMRELGIRMALGAQNREVLKAALGRAFKVLAWGSAAGLLLGILASGVLSAVVYHASSRDPLVLAGVVLAMLLLGVLATWIPAQRALSINPLVLLREE
jgi:predicted permease